MARKIKNPTGIENPYALISNSKLQQMYSTMLKCRMLEARAREINRKGFSGKGTEAISVGIGIDLKPEDRIATAASLTTAHLLKNISLKEIFSHVYAATGEKQKPAGRKTSQPRIPEGVSRELQLGVAAGIGLAHKKKEDDSVTVAFLGEGEVPAAVRDEFLAFAVARGLAILFVSSGPQTDTASSAFGAPIIAVDSNDVVAVYRVAHECMTRARAAGRPSWIQCREYNGRPEGASSNDPLKTMEQYLEAKGLFTREWKEHLIALFDEKLEKGMSQAKGAVNRPQAQAENIFQLPAVR